MIREEGKEEENKWGTVVLLKEKHFLQRSKNGKLGQLWNWSYNPAVVRIEKIKTQMELFELDLLIKGKIILKCFFHLFNIFLLSFLCSLEGSYCLSVYQDCVVSVPSNKEIGYSYIPFFQTSISVS